MTLRSWYVQDLIGKHARVRLIDASSDEWGHINFDDLKGDIVCDEVENWMLYSTKRVSFNRSVHAIDFERVVHNREF